MSDTSPNPETVVNDPKLLPGGIIRAAPGPSAHAEALVTFSCPNCGAGLMVVPFIASVEVTDSLDVRAGSGQSVVHNDQIRVTFADAHIGHACTKARSRA